MEQAAESDQTADMTFADCRRREVEQVADLNIGQFFDMPHQQDVAARLGEFAQHRTDPIDEVSLGRSLRRRLVRLDESLANLGRGVGGEGKFALQRAAGSVDVPPASLGQPLQGSLLQPEAERHRTAGQVVVETFEGFDLRLLHDVGGIDPPPQPIATETGNPGLMANVRPNDLTSEYLRFDGDFRLRGLSGDHGIVEVHRLGMIAAVEETLVEGMVESSPPQLSVAARPITRGLFAEYVIHQWQQIFRDGRIAGLDRLQVRSRDALGVLQ